ncbi:TPA: hypothetical protein MJF14_004542 [Klebsiella pneumoniae]|nr:hypothetical protein [Klebsiella pneumoniae]HBY8848180.1 hypothetical protein [Klebsiella pneumoniae]HBY9098532.1 hypothetical protein [Klebsiella pneumoniae]HBY9103986.1 hypothetical protein [Klebsiella pneumoniae]HBY9354735.1 hypothetical protein [Klebsiella pneumoniae]
MTITLQAVNELIASLETAGELSIRETKVMALAKAFKQLAAENVALKSKGKELLGEACAVYSKLNKLIDPSIGDFVDGQTLHEFQFVLDAETPATDRIVAGIKADGVKLVKSAFEEHIQSPSCYQDEVVGMESALSIASQVESQLREGADK